MNETQSVSLQTLSIYLDKDKIKYLLRSRDIHTLDDNLF